MEPWIIVAILLIALGIALPILRKRRNKMLAAAATTASTATDGTSKLRGINIIFDPDDLRAPHAAQTNGRAQPALVENDLLVPATVKTKPVRSGLFGIFGGLKALKMPTLPKLKKERTPQAALNLDAMPEDLPINSDSMPAPDTSVFEEMEWDQAQQESAAAKAGTAAERIVLTDHAAEPVQTTPGPTTGSPLRMPSPPPTVEAATDELATTGSLTPEPTPVPTPVTPANEVVDQLDPILANLNTTTAESEDDDGPINFSGQSVLAESDRERLIREMEDELAQRQAEPNVPAPAPATVATTQAIAESQEAADGPARQKDSSLAAQPTPVTLETVVVRTYRWPTFMGEDAQSLGDPERSNLIKMLRDMHADWCLPVLMDAFDEESPDGLRPSIVEAIAHSYNGESLNEFYEYCIEHGTTDEKRISTDAMARLEAA